VVDAALSIPGGADRGALAEPTYAECEQVRGKSARDRARLSALSALAWLGKRDGAIERGLARKRIHLVYLHHVFRDEEAGFRSLVKSLAAGHEFIGHSEAVHRIHDGRIDRPYVSFSFDDGFADNIRAARVLEEYGTTGCFFVCPGIVGEQDPSRLRRFCVDRLQFPVATPFLDWRQLEMLVARGHEIGGHTMTHPDLGATPIDRADEEISRSHDAIRARLGSVAHFAWPRGRWINFTPRWRRAVFDAGFTTCASAVRGAHVSASPGSLENLCLRRDHVVANWPISHIRYLLARSSRGASARDNQWPPEYPAVG
jgi:peptidoglycan/xylan/chitin deacetylase (PgdA/CDA1 family)